eukprot:TRINITY_DN5064_c1_g1_i1.p1 TRINITY_DN5064_c1_g1~~TRINITY_DN5064_c1_g1_i1.p1  ORF type:complete len:386 (-),score=17.14 TRINITY_DN5064_c1_g1_i1:1525-2580(-)
MTSCFTTLSCSLSKRSGYNIRITHTKRRKVCMQPARGQSMQQDSKQELQDVYYQAALRLNSILDKNKETEEEDELESISSFGVDSGVILTIINGALESTIAVAFCRAFNFNILGEFSSLQKQENALGVAIVLAFILALFRLSMWKGWWPLFPNTFENYYLSLKTNYLKQTTTLLRNTGFKGTIISAIADNVPVLLVLLPLGNNSLTSLQRWALTDDVENMLPMYLVKSNSVLGVSVIATIVLMSITLPNAKEIMSVQNAIQGADRYYKDLLGLGEESSKASRAFCSVASTWILSNYQAAAVQACLTFFEILSLQLVWILSGNLIVPGVMLTLARFPNYYFVWKSEQEKAKN